MAKAVYLWQHLASASRLADVENTLGGTKRPPMYAIRCTKKLIDRGMALDAESSVAPTTLLGDWYANIVFTRPQQLVICISERTLLPVIVPAKDLKGLPQRIANAVDEILIAIGVAPEDVAAEISQMSQAYFAKTAGRKILGSLNDFVFHLQDGTASDSKLSLHERALRLAQMPLGVLQYAYATEATLAAFAAEKAIMVAKSAA